MDNGSRRVISISLTEQDWQAFLRIHPQPVVWLREKIQESIAAPIAPVSATGATSTTSATTR